MTEGQHQEDIARLGFQTEGLNPERKQAVTLDSWRSMSEAAIDRQAHAIRA